MNYEQAKAKLDNLLDAGDASENERDALLSNF
jgi:hypothetical protein